MSHVVSSTIVQARSDSITFNRVIADDGSYSIQLVVSGKRLTSTDPAVAHDDITQTYEWATLPQAWRDALLPQLKNISKQFNLLYAEENTETL